jgi:hypothetical protein
MGKRLNQKNNQWNKLFPTLAMGFHSGKNGADDQREPEFIDYPF